MSIVDHSQSTALQYSCTFRILSDSLLSRTDVGASAKLVLLGLQAFGHGGAKCFPSNETLGKRCGLSEATIKRSLAELAKSGLIAVIKDPSTPKGRRLDKIWLSDPNLHPRRLASPALQGQIDPRPTRSICTETLEGQSEPQENYSERTKEMIVTDPSSSSDVLIFKQETTSQTAKGCTGVGEWCVDEAIRLFQSDQNGRASIRTRTLELCSRYGEHEVSTALDSARRKIESGVPVTWRYVMTASKNQSEEGGAVGRSLTREELQRREKLERRENEVWMNE